MAWVGSWTTWGWVSNMTPSDHHGPVRVQRACLFSPELHPPLPDRQGAGGALPLRDFARPALFPGTGGSRDQIFFYLPPRDLLPALRLPPDRAARLDAVPRLAPRLGRVGGAVHLEAVAP